MVARICSERELIYPVLREQSPDEILFMPARKVMRLNVGFLSTLIVDPLKHSRIIR
jgi:hypothetical protein